MSNNEKERKVENWEWIPTAWALFNSACAAVTAYGVLAILRRMRKGETAAGWRRTTEWQEKNRTERLRSRGYGPDGVPLAGERADVSREGDGDARQASS